MNKNLFYLICISLVLKTGFAAPEDTTTSTTTFAPETTLEGDKDGNTPHSIIAGNNQHEKTTTEDPYYDHNIDNTNENVVDVINNDPDLSSLANALRVTGLDTVLRGTDPVTIFAPNNAAFAALGPVNNVTFLREVLLYHVLGEGLESIDITNGLIKNTLLTNQRIKFDIRGNDVFILTTSNGESRIIDVDLEGENGFVHKINTVLIPGNNMDFNPVNPPNNQENIVDIINNDPELSSLSNALQLTGLDSILRISNPATIFAPTNAAFAALGPVNDINFLRNVLLYHVIGELIKSNDITNGLVKKTLLTKQTIRFEIKSNGIFIATTSNGRSKIIAVDTLGSNGVIHKIDTVLIFGANNFIKKGHQDEQTTTEEPIKYYEYEETKSPTKNKKTKKNKNKKNKKNGSKKNKGNKNGKPGSPGKPGATGKQGPPGKPGKVGPKGDKGEVGYPGKNGYNGLRGPQGPQGPSGKSKIGPQGMKGERGYPGHNGKIGYPGKNGKDGKPGKAGYPGKPGKTGPTGAPGLKGDRGFPGHNGKPGKPGIDGRPGVCDASKCNYRHKKSNGGDDDDDDNNKYNGGYYYYRRLQEMDNKNFVTMNDFIIFSILTGVITIIIGYLIGYIILKCLGYKFVKKYKSNHDLNASIVVA